MIKQLARISSHRQVLVVVFAITATSVLRSTGLTALATASLPNDARMRGPAIATLIPLMVAPTTSYWIADAVPTIAKLKDAVDRLARTDELTNLQNRRSFLADTDVATEKARQRDARLSLLVVVPIISNISMMPMVMAPAMPFLSQQPKSCRNRSAPISTLSDDSEVKNSRFC